MTILTYLLIMYENDAGYGLGWIDLSPGEKMKRILDAIANPKMMYIDEKVPFYSLRRRLAARMDKHPEQLNQVINSLHELIHELQSVDDT